MSSFLFVFFFFGRILVFDYSIHIQDDSFIKWEANAHGIFIVVYRSASSSLEFGSLAFDTGAQSADRIWGVFLLLSS
jgi:hypothetical protein